MCVHVCACVRVFIHVLYAAGAGPVLQALGPRWVKGASGGIGPRGGHAPSRTLLGAAGRGHCGQLAFPELLPFSGPGRKCRDRGGGPRPPQSFQGCPSPESCLGAGSVDVALGPCVAPSSRPRYEASPKTHASGGPGGDLVTCHSLVKPSSRATTAPWCPQAQSGGQQGGVGLPPLVQTCLRHPPAT